MFGLVSNAAETVLVIGNFFVNKWVASLKIAKVIGR